MSDYSQVFDTIEELLADLTNLLENPSFEEPWTTDATTGNQRPNGWDLTWKQPGESMLSAGAFPDEPDPFDTVLTVPECVHKLSVQLPPDEQLGGENALILEGNATYKMNGVGFSATLSQAVTDLPPGATVIFRVPLQVHHHNDGSWGACASRLWVNAYDSRWSTFTDGLEDRAWCIFTASVVVPASGVCEVGMDVEGRAIVPVDFFTDALSFEIVEEPPSPECPTPPRHTSRVYNVIPQDATEARAVEIFLHGWREGKQTAGGSSDDAGEWGGIEHALAKEWDRSAQERPQYTDFYEQNYPGTQVVFMPDSPEPPPIEPPVIEKWTGTFIGLHMQHLGSATWDEYVLEGKPSPMKAFSCGDAVTIGRLADPRTLKIWRHYEPNNGAWLRNPDGSFLNDADMRASARNWLDYYSTELDLVAQNWETTVPELLAHIDVLVSLNEVIAGNNPEIFPAVAFDCMFAEEVNIRYGPLVRAGMLNVAVGNPGPEDVAHLLPCAKMSSDYGHFLGYHCYWTAGYKPGQSYVYSAEWNGETHVLWPHLAGRWTEWDKVFAAHGYAPLYYGGETGMVFNYPDWPPWWVHSGRSWKEAGDFPYYIEQIDEFNTLVNAWNAAHGNRYFGAVLFSYPAWGWDEFTWNDGDTLLLRDWAAGVPIALSATRVAYWSGVNAMTSTADHAIQAPPMQQLDKRSLRALATSSRLSIEILGGKL